MAVVIPRTVHRIWFGPRLMRAELVAYGRTWERHGYEVKLWTEDNLPYDSLRNLDIYNEIERNGVVVGGGVEELGVWVQRADVIGYELIYLYGGIYANTDMECLKPLDGLLDGVTAFAGWEEQDRYVCNALMGCTPGHPFFGAVLDELPGRYRARRGEPMNIQTGPRLITDMHTEISGLTVFDQPLIYPYGYTEMNREWDDHPEAYTSHHWGHTRGRWSEERI